MSVLRVTQSLCPVCLRRVDAAYVRQKTAWGSEVRLCKTCPEHGAFSVPVWPDLAGTPAFAAWARPKTPSYPRNPATGARQGCPYDCGLCPEHGQHTCTGLVEVTQRCDMRCPVCYADAGQAADHPPLERVLAQLHSLRRAAGPCNVQLSGGEPTQREDLPRIIAAARACGFGLVQLNTNGLRLGAQPGYAAALRQAGLDSVYLQWDGVTEQTFTALRGRPCMEEKAAAVRACAAAGLGIVLVATLARGINDGEVGALLRMALGMGAAVRGVHFQPFSAFGRCPWPLLDAPRLTLPELMRHLELQAPELVAAAHFHPPGCEHALCSFSAAYQRTEDDGLRLLPQAGGCCAPSGELASTPVPAAEGARRARAFVARHWAAPEKSSKGPPLAGQARPHGADSLRGARRDSFLQTAASSQEQVQERALPAGDALGRFLAAWDTGRHFTVSAMAFQDALSLDVARVRGCCIHVAAADGRLIPFCLYNLTARDGQPLYREGAPRGEGT